MAVDCGGDENFIDCVRWWGGGEGRFIVPLVQLWLEIVADLRDNNELKVDSI